MSIKRSVGWIILSAYLVLYAYSAHADEARVIMLGIYGEKYSNVQEKYWKNLANYITKKVKHHTVKIKILSLEEMNRAVQHHELNFLITDPVNYIRLNQTGMQVILAATVDERFEDKIIGANAGAILSLKNRNDLKSISDLKGKTVAVNGDGNLGAWYAVEERLLDAGLNPKHDIKVREFNKSSSDPIVRAIVSGKVDAGIVPAGILESLKKSNSKLANKLKVINEQDVYDFPYLVSTRLYPNDPLIIFPYMNHESDLSVVSILQSIPTGDALLKNVGIYKFGLPDRYDQTENLMKTLRAPPFDDVPEITVGEIWYGYKYVIIVALFGFLILGIMAIVLLGVNRKLAEQRKHAQNNSDALARRTEQFYLAIRATNDGLWDWDLVTNEVYFSPRWKEMLGYEDKEIENALSSWEKLVDPDGRESTMKLVAECKRGERDGFVIEFRMCHKDGHWVDVLSRAILVRDDGGNALRMVGTHVDISRQKCLEQRLRESEQQSKLIIDRSPNAIIVVNDEDKIIRINPQVENLFDYSKEELIDQPIDILIPKEFINTHLNDDEQINKLQKDNESSGSKITNEIVYAVQRDGKEIPCEIGVTPVEINHKRHVIFTIDDISSRINAARKLEQQNSLLTTIIESMPMRVFWKNCDLEYMGCNSLFAYDAGFGNTNQVIGKSDREMAWNEQSELYQSDDRKVLELGEVKLNYVESQKTPGGKQIWLRTSKVPLRDSENEIIGILGIYQDITEERESEDKLRYFKNMLDQIYDCVFMFDAHSLKFTYVNKSGIEQVGYDENIIHEMHPYDIKPNYTEEQFKEMIAPMLRGEVFFHHFETVHRYREGRDIPVDIFLQLVTSGDGEKNFIAIVRDVSERKAMEDELINHQVQLEKQVALRTEELQQVTAYNRMLFDTSPIGLALCDMEGRLIDMNPTYLKIIGYSEDEAKKLSYWEITPRDYESLELVQLESMKSTGHYGPYEKEYLHKDGRRIPVRLNGLIIERDGEQFIWSAIEDISELRTNEQRLDTIIENLPAVFFMKDTVGRYMMVNREYEEAVGVRKNNVIGRDDYELFEKEVADALTNRDRLVLGSQIPVAFEESVPHSDGSDHEYLTTKVPLFDEKGQVYAMFGIATDVTDIKTLQSELSKAQSIGHMGSWSIDLRRNEYTWSEETRRIFGTTEKEHIDFDLFMERVYKDDRDAVINAWHAALAGKPYDIEHRIVVRDEIRWVHEQAEVTFDDKKQPIATVGTVLDITERKMSEEKLRDAEERYRLLFTSSQDAIMTLSPPNWCFTSANSSALKLFGVQDEKSYIKLGLWDVSPTLQPDGRKSIEKAKEMINTAMKNGSHMFEWQHCRVDNVEFPATVLLSRVEINGKSILQGTIRDISVAKAAEKAMLDARNKAEHLAKAKTEFLANMSHEIRTPINSVLGMARIGERKSRTNSEESQQYFKRIITSGEHLLGVINDILDYSKLEAGKFSIDNTHTFNLKELIDGIADMLEGALKQKGLGFVNSLSENLPLWVKGDAQRLRQILMNLLSNAIKFTGRGKVSLNVTRNGKIIYFKVSDTGIGISPRKISDLFAPFAQVDGSNTREHGGTGLGLVISKKLAQGMGGDISVESYPGVGSTFTLVLPLPESRPKKMDVLDMPVKRAGKQLEGIRVLAVDDVEDNRIILEDLLVQEGALVDFAENGLRATQKVEGAVDKIYDLVLMDVQMPVMNGYEATKRIKQAMPDLPVIGLTAHAMESERARCLDAGMSEHVAKPIEPDHLIGVIQKYIHRKAQNTHMMDNDGITSQVSIVNDTYSWPSDTPVDFADGLARVRGNEKLYRQLLRNFDKRWSNLIDQLKELLDNNDWDEVLRTLHTLKGSSGNIGAKKLFSETVKYEELSFKRDENSVREELEKFRFHLDEVINCLRVLPAQNEKTTQNNDTGNFSDLDDVVVLFEKLIYFLDNDLGQAKACLARIKQLKVDGPILAAITDIENAMRNFDNDAAKTIVRRVQTA